MYEKREIIWARRLGDANLIPIRVQLPLTSKSQAVTLLFQNRVSNCTQYRMITVNVSRLYIKIVIFKKTHVL